jgi:hypothetical protein
MSRVEASLARLRYINARRYESFRVCICYVERGMCRYSVVFAESDYYRRSGSEYARTSNGRTQTSPPPHPTHA